jgi:hypothetical protein
MMKRIRHSSFAYALVPAVLFLGTASGQGVPLKLSLTMEPAPSNQPWAEPARFSYTNSSLYGTGYTVNGALTAVYAPNASESGNGWWPYFSLQMAHNLVAAKEKLQDFRRGELGVAGQYGADVERAIERRKNWFTFFPKLSFSAGRNELTGIDTLRVESSVSVYSNLFDRLSTASIDAVDTDLKPVKRTASYGITFLPTLGLYNDQIRDAPADKTTGLKPTGRANGVLGRLQIKYVPFAKTDQFFFTGSAFVQRNTSANGIRRETTYKMYKGSIDYLLYSPANAKSLLLLPRLTLERTFGEDPYTGFARQGVTTVGFKLISN